MAEIITGPFHMDEQGFLATIEELIERFDGYSSGKYLAELGKIHDEYGEIGPLSLFDEKPYLLKLTLSGNRLLSGGDMKLEGCIIMLICQSLLCVFFILRLKKRGHNMRRA